MSGSKDTGFSNVHSFDDKKLAFKSIGPAPPIPQPRIKIDIRKKKKDEKLNLKKYMDGTALLDNIAKQQKLEEKTAFRLIEDEPKKNHYLAKTFYDNAGTETPLIRPPTVELTQEELGDTNSNSIIPSRSVMDQKLLKLANEKKRAEMTAKKKTKLSMRVVGDKVWVDPSIADFDPNDYRVFVGDMGFEVTDEMLRNAFSHYSSLQSVKVVKHKRSRRSRGYGFVSFKNPTDYLKAIKEMNGKYIGVRPIKCRKSTWYERCYDFVENKKKENRKNGYKA